MQIKTSLFVAGFFLLNLSSCVQPVLRCRSEHLDPCYLASSHVHSPDPCSGSFYGEQIIISWDLSLKGEAELQLDVRYGNLEHAHFSRPIHKGHDQWIYRLMNGECAEKQGIISYRARIVQGGLVLASWTHSLWTEIITIKRDKLYCVGLDGAV